MINRFYALVATLGLYLRYHFYFPPINEVLQGGANVCKQLGL